MSNQDAIRLLQRIANALERQGPPAEVIPDFKAADAFVWEAAHKLLQPVAKINAVALSLLQGLEEQRDTLLANTRQFAQGFAANNALLWGARGMGKSSLVKAVHAQVLKEFPGALALVEIHREDLASLPALLTLLKGSHRKFILFCDDLSFDDADVSYKSLKTLLEGGLEGRPDNVLFYATSNRRHLMPRQMIENERSTAIHPGEAVEEKVSLSDRFGLWLGFHPCDQDTYFAMVAAYAKQYKLSPTGDALNKLAHEWAMVRGGRSGRVAWQFIQDLAGKENKAI